MLILSAEKSASGKTAFKTSSDTVINDGDTLIALGEPGDLRQLEKFL